MEKGFREAAGALVRLLIGALYKKFCVGFVLCNRKKDLNYMICIKYIIDWMQIINGH